MARRAFRRWTVAALLTGLAGIAAAGCVAVPVGGYGPEVVVPAPGVVVVPGPVYGPYYRGYGYRHYRHGYRG